MRSGSRNFSLNKARNTGQSNRASRVIELELDKSTQVYDKAFSANSEESYLYRWIPGGRKCSHLDFVSTGTENFSEDSDFDAPTIIIDEDDDNDDELILDSTLEMLQESKDICPICYGTGTVGNYRVINAFEIYFDVTYEKRIKSTDVVVEKGKPFFFHPISDNASITFKANLPSFFNEFGRLTTISKEARRHTDFDRSLVQIGHVNESKSVLSEIDLESFLQENPVVEIQFAVKEDTHGFFLRLLNGKCTINVNFPTISEDVEDGEYDYYDSLTTSVDSTELVSTRDIIREIYYNRFWKITSIDEKMGLHKDLGKEVGLRRVRAFERFALLP